MQIIYSGGHLLFLAKMCSLHAGAYEVRRMYGV